VADLVAVQVKCSMNPPLKLHIMPGDQFGRGTVLEEIRVPRTGRKTGVRGARLRCTCGNIYTAWLTDLFHEKVRSCGCWHLEILPNATRTHGLSNHPLYESWTAMRDRCSSTRPEKARCYAERGISICDRWSDPAIFIADIERLIGPKPQGMTLDRINNDGNYEPGNVRWATYAEQNFNTRRSLERRRLKSQTW